MAKIAKSNTNARPPGGMVSSITNNKSEVTPKSKPIIKKGIFNSIAPSKKPIQQAAMVPTKTPTNPKSNKSLPQKKGTNNLTNDVFTMAPPESVDKKIEYKRVPRCSDVSETNTVISGFDEPPSPINLPIRVVSIPQSKRMKQSEKNSTVDEQSIFDSNRDHHKVCCRQRIITYVANNLSPIQV